MAIALKSLLLRAILIIGAIVAVNAPAQAHPHVWVDYYVDAVGGKGGITKIKFHWHFDDMFTSMIKENFHVQTLDAKHIETLRKGAFSNLKNYHYYIYLTLDGKEYLPENVSTFDAALKGHNLEYMFTVDLPQPTRKVELSLYDPEFYVDIGPPIQPMSANAPGVMASGTMEPKDFLSSSAEDGGKAPKCEWHRGQPRMSSAWGKFALFIISCTAQ